MSDDAAFWCDDCQFWMVGRMGTPSTCVRCEQPMERVSGPMGTADAIRFAEAFTLGFERAIGEERE